MTYQELLIEYTSIKSENLSIKEENDSVKQEISSIKQENASLKSQLTQLYKLIKGFKSERFVPEASSDSDQLLLFEQEQEQEQPHIEDSKTDTITYTRKKKKHPGRRSIPEHLPVREVVIEPQEDTTGLKKIGEEITETLEYTPASLVKKRTIRPKYAKSEAERVVIAPLPSRPLDKCIAEASLLAHILVSKYVDHLPFYRQIQRFKRDFSWELAPSTVSDWMSRCCVLLELLYNHLKQKILESGYIQADNHQSKY